MATTNLKKSKQGYNYKYVELSQIHEYLEENDMSYYQYIQTENDVDYIYTVPIINNEEKAPRRGCRIVDAPLQGKSNAAQEQGSAITYARRYSLLMAFGLATEDDDAEMLTRQKQQKAQQQSKPAQSTPPEPQPTDGIVTEKDLAVLREMFKSKGIEEKFALDLYKIKSLEGITQSKYANMVKNIDKIKEAQEEKK
ncbi:MAG: ERF family protein [Oscillospiraceae bacterium]|nr:ERF family protein [Oscillospiraceae bacterium]MBR0340711.1 ERF family protein [Oscillospiraceae bacterium]